MLNFGVYEPINSMFMKLLTAPRKKYLLESGIDILHLESSIWLNTIAFWEDESRFYRHLLRNQLFQNVPEIEKKRIAELFENFVGIKLQIFKSQVMLHEKELYQLLSSKLPNTDFRIKHKSLLKDYLELDKQIKLYKSSIFEFFKTHKV